MAQLRRVEEAATYLGVHYITVRRWIRQGRIPVVRFGTRVLIRQEALDQFIKQAERKGRPRPGGIAAV